MSVEIKTIYCQHCNIEWTIEQIKRIYLNYSDKHFICCPNCDAFLAEKNN